MRDLGPLWDTSCQSEIAQSAHLLEQGLQGIVGHAYGDEVKADLFCICLRFLLEFSYASDRQFQPELQGIVDFAFENKEKFGERNQRQIEDAFLRVPLRLIREVMTNDVVGAVREWSATATGIGSQVSEWQHVLVSSRDEVRQLAETLSTHATGFNFVGLHKGFHELHGEKLKERESARKAVVALALASPVPLLGEAALAGYLAYQGTTPTIGHLLTLIPAVTATVLLIYFFRIAMAGLNSVKSQIVQLEVRKALCQFVQKYAEYAGDLKGKSPETLSKFESLVFSNIVLSDEKMPATFDGVEQLTALFKAAKGP